MFIDLVTLRSKPQNSPRIEVSKYKIALMLLRFFHISSSPAAKIQRRPRPMRFDLKQSFRVAATLFLAAVFALPLNLVAETATHLVSPADLQQAAVKASAARQQNRVDVENFVSSETAQNALKSAHINPEQVKAAVSSLDDAELAQLASRVHKTQADFAAGSLSDRDLIIILVAVAVLILIIVAVR
jgi:hypothetical protein